MARDLHVLGSRHQKCISKTIGCVLGRPPVHIAHHCKVAEKRQEIDQLLKQNVDSAPDPYISSFDFGDIIKTGLPSSCCLFSCVYTLSFTERCSGFGAQMS